MKKLWDKGLYYWHKYYEVLTYLIFGGLATLLNVVLYVVNTKLFGYAAANSWGNVLDNIVCILFAYWTNRTWVFISRTHGADAWREFVKFVTCRLGTLVVDTVIVFVGGNLLGPVLVPQAWQEVFGVGVKIFANIVVIVLNYIFSKRIIFRKKQ